ncbi:unnamed protein product [Didymodactylos carnosus]|uniref:ADP-ribosylglycohydrolase n=1 Tax=Didymodactylos carnosus TaxID=1234261 RepID=A0A8S2EPG5_9BILA|nr:unnamed protein product [Didymodactylos carnosus]CAF4012326.1 unnamed protein product [Didymodactylos carnosus]
MDNSLAEWLNGRHLPHTYTLKRPPSFPADLTVSPDKIIGSLAGLALGDALGAHVEFRPRSYMLKNPVSKLIGGGTWGLKPGQWTDDTSMALCLATSLIVNQDFNPYDQLVRYKWWWKHGYMSSTGTCFDIGTATQESLQEFYKRQMRLKQHLQTEHSIDMLPKEKREKFDCYCSHSGVAGNGALMRLAPVPLFFSRSPVHAVEYAGISARLTHGDEKAVDACRYYAALICAAVNGYNKDELLHEKFYQSHFDKGWFGTKHLHEEVYRVARGSYKKHNGYDEGIRGKGYIVNALEAALWAFWGDNDSFKDGALRAVNLGDDTDTTAAIYGQLAGAVYGMKGLPEEWLNQLYARDFIICLGMWIHVKGYQWIVSLNANLWESQLVQPDKLQLHINGNVQQPVSNQQHIRHAPLQAPNNKGDSEKNLNIKFNHPASNRCRHVIGYNVRSQPMIQPTNNNPNTVKTKNTSPKVSSGYGMPKHGPEFGRRKSGITPKN